MGRARTGFALRGRPIAIGAAALAVFATTLAAGRALTDPPEDAVRSAPSVEAGAALQRLDAGPGQLARATVRAQAAIVAATAALADDGPAGAGRRADAREEVVGSRLALLALEDGASTGERRAISEANRALQRLVLELDEARRDG